MKDSRKSFTSTLLELARNDKDIIAVTTDARGSVTLGDFAKELPSQFVECGIAEQDAVGISAGLAHSGKKVFCCGPACFYVARSLEQVKVDVAYSRNPVKILGVSGGIAYVLDEDASLYRKLNKTMVSLEPVTDKYDVLELKEIITEHVAYTNSKKGKEIFDHFSEYLPKFKKIVPHDYKKMMMTIVQMEEKGLSSEQAQIEAFNALTK